MGLVESDLIDYTPAIKEAALKIAQQCRICVENWQNSARGG
jgi:hypothetical protein